MITLNDSIAVIVLVTTLGLAFGALMLAVRNRQSIRYLLHQHHAITSDNAELWNSVFELRRILAPLQYKSHIDSSQTIQSWSQHGEDLILFELFDGKTDGTFVDVGAYDGLRLSNTAFLEMIGWTGVLVEAHPELAEACRQNRPGTQVIHAAAGSNAGPETILFSMVDGPEGVDTLSFTGEDAEHLRRIASEGGTVRTVTVAIRSLDQILDDAAITKIDLVSIDVEGAEDQVLDGFDLARWNPKAIVVESNSNEAHLCTKTRLQDAGYRYVRSIGANDLFVRTGWPESKSIKE